MQNDILKEYVARGTWIYPPAPSMRLVTDLFAYCAERVPKWNTISISGYHIREAGATAPQELAFTFANAIEYVRAAKSAGLDPDRFGERLSFFFACHSDFLEEVAKFRCARRLWARIMKERFGVTNPKAQQCRFHVQTGGVTLTAQQPDNNVVRVALQALAAVLGGCQSLHTNGARRGAGAADRGLGAARAAHAAGRRPRVGRRRHRRPARRQLRGRGGDRRARERRRCASSTRSRRAAGRSPAIERGDVQREIQESAYRYQRQVEAGERVIVGVNRFQEEGEAAPGRHPAHRPRARARAGRAGAGAARAARPRAWQAALDALEARARSGENLVPAMVDAVLAWATVGEIANRLRGVFGEHRETLVL